MNGEDLRSLASRADGVNGRAETRLTEVHTRIATARRRRAVGAVAGTSAAVLALVVGAVLVSGPTGHEKGDGPLPPAETPAKIARKIVYSDTLSSVPHKGDLPLLRVATVHVGDREARIDQVLHTVQGWALVATDAGAVYARDDQTVWMTDGGEPHRIAERACVDTTQASGLAAGTGGPWVVWFDCSSASRGADLVVFDTVAGREVARHTVPSCRGRKAEWPAHKCEPELVVGDHVYFRVLVDAARDVRRGFVLDATSDELVPATPAALAGDIDSHPRGLVIGADRQTGIATTGLGQVFRVVGARLVPVVDSDSEPVLARAVFDTATGRAVQLRLPEGYRARRSDATDDPPFFFMSGWLDDDTVALVRGNTSTHLGDILVCHLSDGRCRVAVEAPHVDATRIVAGVQLPG